MPAETIYVKGSRDFSPTINVNYQSAEPPLVGATFSLQVQRCPGEAQAPQGEDGGVTFSDGVPSDAPNWRPLTLEPRIARAARLPCRDRENAW